MPSCSLLLSMVVTGSCSCSCETSDGHSGRGGFTSQTHQGLSKICPKQKGREKPGSNQVEEYRDYFLLQSLGNQVKIRL